MRAVVVGAGFAGLSAATELRAAGWEVRVLEARDRVGGRVWSRRLANGSVIEMGAEFLLPGNTAVRELATDLGLDTWEKGIRYGRREPRGGPPVDHEALAEALAAIEAELDADPERSGVAAPQLLTELGIGPGPREYILARTEISCASAADAVPAGDLLGVAHVDDHPSPSIAGGNQRIAGELARRLGEAVRLRAPVRRISWLGGDGVRLATDGDEARADVAVVAVPARVLGAIEFDPPLPRGRRQALAAVRYGHAAKLFVPLAERPQPRAVMSVPERYWTWTATGEGDRPQPVLSAFAGSPAALERLAVGEGPRAWLDSIRRLRPELELQPDEALLSTWSDDEWVRGAYSVSPGPELTARLAEPLGPIRFAGEHLAGRFSGLMEGAIRSGRAAAHGLLAA